MTPAGLRAARFYLQHWRTRVVPVAPGRRAALVGATGPGHEQASDDPDTIVKWWRRWPWADPALLTTGRIVLLDIDVKHGIDGRDTLHDLEQRHGALPPTPTAETPHGGLHLYFRAPAVELKNSVAKLGAAVDIRGRASLVYPPPCRGYSYLLDSRPDELALAELPAAWVSAIQALDAARGEWGESFRLPDVIEKGIRNDVLFRYAASMRAREVEWTWLTSAVWRANAERCSPPLPNREVTAILRSAEAYPVGRSHAA